MLNYYTGSHHNKIDYSFSRGGNPMRNILWLALACLLMLAFAAGCPRDKDDDDVNVVVRDNQDGADSTIVKNGEDADSATPPAGDTDIDINVDTKDESAADADADTPPATDTPADAAPPAAGTTRVSLVTTKGNIELTVHPEWDQIGAAHFLELVNAGFYNGSPWFRVIPGFVAQTGVNPDPAVTSKWSSAPIKDSPVIKGNSAGTVAFAKPGMPDSRSAMFFINLADNSQSLDPQGFSAFAEVTTGMDVALALFPAEFADQGALQGPGGIELFKTQFPQGDFITTASVVK
jgi:cyclophilin family peptidyl-prolyl cis-trans isomerase